MTYHPGLDCALVIDDTGYFIDPTSFAVSRPRVHAATVTLGGVRFADLGPAKRQWTFTVLAHQDMRDYAGQHLGDGSGEWYRSTLRMSYEKLSTISFIDPHSDTFTVFFTGWSEQIEDVAAQAAGAGPSGADLQYSIHVTLLEA